MILHLVSQPPSHSALQDCLQLLGESDALLLLSDGVYALAPGTASLTELAKCGAKVYALGPDLAMRGLLAAAPDFVDLVDYDGFVSLTVHYDTTQSWY